MKYQIYCDGGARGNPGPAGAGFVVFDETGKTLIRGMKYLGQTTNNVAEYSAVITALEWFFKNISAVSPSQNIRIDFFLDSMLVVNQLNGLFKIKNARLRNLAIKVRQLENKIGASVWYRFVPREKNQIADGLVNKALNAVNAKK